MRLVAQRLHDGRIEIGLQERESGGAWGERQLPDARFLPAEATAGQWRTSSPVDVGAGHWFDGALACIVGHGEPRDGFWRQVGRTVELAGEDLKMDVRFVVGETPERQAALVRECIGDDAKVIATTLASPDAMASAIADAREAGVQVVTFNSGGEHASAIGSTMHIGLHDRQGGERAGAAFNAKGVNGTVLCVIHELENVGLEERCDGLESAYSGDVERLRVGETGVSDLEGSQAAIEQRISEGGIGGILTLNSNLLEAALAARGDAKIEVASFGWSPGILAKLLSRQVLFVIYDQPHAQAYLTSAMLALLGFAGQSGDAALVFGGAQVLIEPALFDFERAARWAGGRDGNRPDSPSD